MRRGALSSTLAILLTLSSVDVARAVDKTFSPTFGEWLKDENWSPPGVPGPMDDVTLESSHSADLLDDTAIRNLTLDGGQVSGSGSLTVSGRLTWLNGGMNGNPSGDPATTTVGDGMDLPSGGGTRSLANRVLDLTGGTSTLSGAQTLLNLNNATLNNNAVFEADDDGGDALQGFSGFPGTFNNMGTFRKMPGNTGTTMFQGVDVNNFGTVEVLSGILDLAGAGTAGAASTFSVAAGAELRFEGLEHSLAPGSHVSGAGKVSVPGGTVDVGGLWDVDTTQLDGGGLNLQAPVTIPHLILSGGQVSGDQTLTVTDSLIWTSGSMIGSGVTNAENGIDLSGGKKDVAERTINLNGGTATLTGFGSELNFESATFNNHAVFDVEDDSASYKIKGSGMFDNAGEFHAVASVMFQGVQFANSGTVEVHVQMTASGGYHQTAGVTRLFDATLQSFGADPFQFDGGTLEDSGNVFGSLVNGGRVSPGLSAGRLFIQGDYTQEAGGRLRIEIGGRDRANPVRRARRHPARPCSPARSMSR